MDNLTKYSEYADKINQIEQELEFSYDQSAKEFPDQDEKRTSIMLELMMQKIENLFKDIPEENRVDFQNYIRERFNLKNEADLKEFALTAPKKIEDLIRSSILN